MNDIEAPRLLGQAFQQYSLCSSRVCTWPGKPESARPDGNEGCCRPRITACEKSDLVARGNQFLRQPRNDALCTAIEFGWNAFGEGRDLRNPHQLLSNTIREISLS